MGVSRKFSRNHYACNELMQAAASLPFSFAAVCHEALTGKRVARGDDFGQVLMSVLGGSPPAISQLLPGMAPEVDAVGRLPSARGAISFCLG